MQLDKIDKKLLGFLQANSKITHKQLSINLNLSTTAIYERIKKLEREGVIHKYIALIDKEKVNRGFMVLCHIKLVQHSNEYLTKFEREVVKLDEVLECFNVSGDYDYILKVVVKNMKAYREFINKKLTKLQFIGSTQSTFIISELKNSTEVII